MLQYIKHQNDQKRFHLTFDYEISRDVSIGLRNSLIEFVQLKKKKGFIMIGLFSLEKIMIFGPGLNGLGIL